MTADAVPADLAPNLAAMRERLCRSFPDVWDIHARDLTAAGDHLRLLYSACCTLRLGGTTVWIDIAVPGFAAMPADGDLAAMFRGGGVFLITHGHPDHFAPRVIAAAARTPSVRFATHATHAAGPAALGVARSRIIPVLPEGHFTVDGLAFAVTATPHVNIADSVAYAIRGAGRCVLALGDLREYPADLARSLPAHDIMLFNVWLGRGRALAPDPEILAAAVAFIREAAPRTVFLLHLYELNREPADIWTYLHAGMVRKGLEAAVPGITVRTPAPNQICPVGP
ncbi:MAG: MBL fold metallo-hydrolase [Planctomycetota bacterium]